VDFVVLSHRHGDQLAHALSVNPKVKIYAPKDGLGGVYGSSIASSFYRKDDFLPPEMRYYDGKPPDILKLGTAWQDAGVCPSALPSELIGVEDQSAAHHASKAQARLHAEAGAVCPRGLARLSLIQ
jgi:hypothetical protein